MVANKQMPVLLPLAQARIHYRSTWVPYGYRAWAHLGFVCVWSIALAVGSFTCVRAVSLSELLVVPISFVFANWVEYAAHRWPMHHRTRGAAILFDRHTLIHHAFFTHQVMEIEFPNDTKMVLFPAAAGVAFVCLVAAPTALLISFLISPNSGYLFFGTGVSYFLAYEWLHWSYHQPARHWVRRIPILKSLSAHHVVHHDQRLMSRFHFNITFPIFDWALGTKRRAAR